MTDVPRDWDIATSVGSTAAAAAALRALEGHHENPLVRDPFAAGFVKAANLPVPVPTSPGEIVDYRESWEQGATFLGLRSRLIDTQVVDAVASGVRQVVILAAGLDARAFRLDLPSDTTVFEIDQPRVLEFKDQVLAAQGAKPVAVRKVVPVDLREDWRSALLAAGFDPGKPAVWLAEGLLPYLPKEAANALIETIHGLSAPDSVIVVEHFGDIHAAMADGPDVSDLIDTRLLHSAMFPGGERESPEAFLRPGGWQLSVYSAGDLAKEYGRPLKGPLGAAIAKHAIYIAGTLQK